MRNPFSLTPLIGAFFCLSFLFLIPTQSKAVHLLIPPNLKLLDTIPVPALKDTVPEIQKKTTEARFRTQRKAAIILAISGGINLGLGALLLTAGMKSAYVLTMILGAVFGYGIMTCGGIMLLLALVFGLSALHAKRRLRKM